MASEKSFLDEIDFGEFLNVGNLGEEGDFELEKNNPYDHVNLDDDGKVIKVDENKEEEKNIDSLEEDDDKEYQGSNKAEDFIPSSQAAEKNTESFALVFAKYVAERGVLSNFDEEEFNKVIAEQGEEGALEYLYSSEVETRIDEVKNMYSNDRKEILDYIEMKDAGIDADVAKNLSFTKGKYESITNDDLDDDESLRRSVIKQDLKNTTKMSEDDIDDFVETLVDTGKDVAKAKKSLISVRNNNAEQIKHEKQRVLDNEKKQTEYYKQQVDSLKKSIYDTKEIMGQNVNKQTLQKIEKFLFEPVGKDANGNDVDGITAWFTKNPEKARINLAYAIITEIMDGKLDKLEKKARTNSISHLEKVFSGKSQSVNGNSNMDIEGGDTLKALMNTFKME